MEEHPGAGRPGKKPEGQVERRTRNSMEKRVLWTLLLRHGLDKAGELVTEGPEVPGERWS